MKKPIAVTDEPSALKFREDFLMHLKGGFPVLYVTTHEEQRAEHEITEAAAVLRRPVFHWSVTKGWAQTQPNKPDVVIKNITDPLKALQTLHELAPEDAVFVLRDFHHWLHADAAVISRQIRDMVYLPPVALKSTGRTLVILSPVTRIPVELEKVVTTVDFPLPTRNELGRVLDDIVESVGAGKAAVTNRPGLLDSGRGLTTHEMENILALAVAEQGNLGDGAIATVHREKASVFKKTGGVLEFSQPSENMDQVGGLNELKTWLEKRRRALTDEAKAYGLPSPRGLLLVGIPGTGKSLVAKTVANAWRIPLLRFDVGRVFQSLQGESERFMRTTLERASAGAPNVLWLDEAEKGLSGLQSSGTTDSGTAARIFGTFLTWMAEKKEPVFVIATANNIDALPAEFVRKGRFDEIFFTDLPNDFERVAIFNIHLRKRGRDPELFDIQDLVRNSSGFSGGEIEEAIVSAMFDAFADEKEITTEHVLLALKMTSPLSVTNETTVTALRERAKTSKWREATSVLSPAGQVEARQRRIRA